MNGQEWLAEQFETNRSHLRSVAYRMLGSVNEADDAVQETWLRLSRSDTREVENLAGWLTTVIARVCLDLLRSRKSRREESLDSEVNQLTSDGQPDPEEEALLADSVGLALLVVLDTLTPAERLAFVLHDTFAVSFDEIGRIVGRTPAAARQLASRARRRVQGVTSVPSEDLRRQRDVVDAFLTALRAGDFEGLLAVLDPDVIVHLDPGAGRPGTPTEIRGARNWAQGAIAFSRSARFVEAVLVNGSVGLVLAPHGRLLRALSFKIDGEKIVEVDIIARPDRLNQLDLGIVE
ncbi:MAG TPA: sigma-70 family RNA polymerase sigma factor [Pyrinomonadaceae bacterium]|jgi:RNA polymerase sigma-70 factor (ECF subfamily)|nr:sigma-70 family RNA polymerase sigma factor [Pyrinomonadaceae bacterium]